MDDLPAPGAPKRMYLPVWFVDLTKFLASAAPLFRKRVTCSQMQSTCFVLFATSPSKICSFLNKTICKVISFLDILTGTAMPNLMNVRPGKFLGCHWISQLIHQNRCNEGKNLLARSCTA
jgi:hypothetical protein